MYPKLLALYGREQLNLKLLLNYIWEKKSFELVAHFFLELILSFQQMSFITRRQVQKAIFHSFSHFQVLMNFSFMAFMDVSPASEGFLPQSKWEST